MASVWAQELPAERLLRMERPLVIAHRGYSALAPENTLPAFKAAVEAGADLVELDYHHSSDAVPIVIHDSTLDRTTDAVARWGGKDLLIRSRTSEELRRLEAGLWFESPMRGVALPLLTEAIDAIQRGSVALIEHKSGDALTCAQLLRARDLVNQVVVQSFDWAYLSDFHRIEPRQVYGALGPPKRWEGRELADEEKALSRAWVDRVGTIGARVIVWNNQVTREAVEMAHSRRMKVWIYTVNDPLEAKALLSLGIDGIITDNPAMLWRVLALLK
jgi:glycerophosphoryl diester phosphodiesterase